VIVPQFPAILGASTPGPLLGSTGDILNLIVHAKGVVLVVAIILITMMVLTLFVVFYKLVHITQAQAQSISFLDRFWESKRLDEIYGVAERLKRSPIAAMFRAGYVELSKVKRSRDAAAQQHYGMDAQVSMHERAGDADNVERALARARLAENTKLENLLPFLATTGSAAPFIGLFGTVWGIMEAFMGIAAAGNADLATVAGPIGEALIATAMSLASAIPAVVAYNYFQRRLKVLNAEMTNFSSDFMNIIKRHFF
jgi:biopolymer transport protein TolQ